MKTHTAQKIYFIWFVILTMMAAYNLIHNISDTQQQEAILQEYKNNLQRYETAIKEHNDFRATDEYLKGRVDGLSSAPCSK